MNLLLVDDHALFREGMKLILKSLDETVRIFEVGTWHETTIFLSHQHDAIDLVLLDLKLPDKSGLDSLIALRATNLECPIVVLSGEEDPVVVRHVIDEGAKGFIHKSASPQELILAIRAVLGGGAYVPPKVLADSNVRPLNMRAGFSLLTSRQQEVLTLLIQGLPNKVIAKKLNISDTTVKSHVTEVFSALSVNNRTEVVYAAAKAGRI